MKSLIDEPGPCPQGRGPFPALGRALQRGIGPVVREQVRRSRIHAATVGSTRPAHRRRSALPAQASNQPFRHGEATGVRSVLTRFVQILERA